jgi:uncharacterized protein (TIGR02246 family)
MQAIHFMRGRLTMIGVLALGLGAASQAAAADDATSFCKAALSAFVAAIPSGDAAKVAATFTPNGEWVSPYGVLAGRDAIIKATGAWLKQGDKDDDTLISARMIGDVALCHGSYAFTPASGPAEKGFWTKIARKDGEGWKIDALVVATTPPQ